MPKTPVDEIRPPKLSHGEGDERFRFLVDQAAIGILQVGRDGTFVEVNRAFCEMLARTREDLLTLNFRDVVHPEDLTRAVSLHDDVLSGSLPSYTIEQRYLRPDGAIVWARITSSRARAQDGEAYRISIVEDITAATLAEARHAGDEAKYRAIIDTAVDAIAVIDERGIVQAFNRAAERIFGYCAAEIVGRNVSLLMPEPDRSQHDHYLGAYRRTGEAKIIGIGREVLGQRKDGSVFPLDLSIAEWRAEGRRYFTGVMRDITERKLAEERRQEDDARYRAIVDTAVDAIAVIDEHGTVRSFNRAAEKVFGYAADEVIGKNVCLLMPEPDRSAHDRYIENYRRTGQRKIIGIGREVEGRRRDGARFPLELAIAEWRAGGQRYFTGIMRDVTERKRADDALRRLNETLEQRVAERTRDLEQANERLRGQMESLQRAQAVLQQAQKMEAVGQLTGGIAHDFNNLLTAIAGNLDLIADRIGADERLRRLVDAAQRAAGRGSRLNAQLLAFARRQTLRPETVRLDELLQEFRILIARAVGEATELLIESDPDLWPCLVDPAQVQSAILNLAVNARDAMPAGGRLQIEIRNVTVDESHAVADMAPGAYVMLTVRDTGEGMTSETASRAFEPFFTTKEIGKGTGLGLSQVYGFARQSGGGALLESAPGRGTTVRLYLPKATQDARADAGAATAKDDVTTGIGTILIAEDDPAVLEMAVETLASLGYQTLVAHDGREALRILAAGASIDLLFSDIVMPGGVSGDELAREARRMRPDLPVLLTTGYAAARRRDLRDGARSFPILDKPYRRPELARAIRTVLSQG